ncbi:hypothetical protein [Bathymodiolus platifrons methanotrophic gill symbiont]|uniref:hypothetical protein n=1 Tax=Bathymodiolus platifrons methanotrophic gill symbiont TaxID=113268 RepID=UPI000B4111E1|nr:hypothetical protein [Bathymodiolus platifrons methanotrophic gill symbiont]
MHKGEPVCINAGNVADLSVGRNSAAFSGTRTKQKSTPNLRGESDIFLESVCYYFSLHPLVENAALFHVTLAVQFFLMVVEYIDYPEFYQF